MLEGFFVQNFHIGTFLKAFLLKKLQRKNAYPGIIWVTCTYKKVCGYLGINIWVTMFIIHAGSEKSKSMYMNYFM